MSFRNALERFPTVLTEGAVIERLRRDSRVELDRDVLHAAFLYHDSESSVLAGLYRQYLDIGKSAGLPMVILTPTWRANPERLERAGLGGRDVNGDAVRWLGGLRDGCGDYAEAVFIGGLIGCRGDAYRPDEALSKDRAAQFHRPQLEALARAGADFLVAATLPAISEARGIGRAMAHTGTPYLLSFIIDREGRLLDATPLETAIRELDESLTPAPTGYLINCVHHSVLAAALPRLSPAVTPRLLGFQANTSTKTPAELDGLDYLDTEDPVGFAEAMYDLHRNYGLRILGGCCGTDDSHIRALAARLGTGTA